MNSKMRLCEKLLQETAPTLPFTSIDGGGRFQIREGDSFFSRAFDLLDVKYSLNLDDLLKFFDNPEWFLPDLLSKHALGLVPAHESIDRGAVYRYRVERVVPGTLDDIEHIFVAKPIRKFEGTPEGVAYVADTQERSIQPVKRQATLPQERHEIVACQHSPDEMYTYLRPMMNGPFPPYPPRFRMPEVVLKKRKSGIDYNHTIRFPILEDEHPTALEIGDQFNGIVIGYTYPKDEFRLFEFREQRYLGYIKRESAGHERSPIPTFPYELLHVNLVYRFEVTAIFKRSPEKIFWVSPLTVDFREGHNKDAVANVLYNLTHLNFARK